MDEWTQGKEGEREGGKALKRIEKRNTDMTREENDNSEDEGRRKGDEFI